MIIDPKEVAKYGLGPAAFNLAVNKVVDHLNVDIIGIICYWQVGLFRKWISSLPATL